MRDELLQLDIGDLALTDLSCEVDVLQHVIQTDVVALNSSKRLTQKTPNIWLSRIVDQVVIARLLGHPEVSILLVPAFVLSRGLSLSARLTRVDLDLNHLFSALLEQVRAALEE